MRHILKPALICCCLALLAGCAAGRSAFKTGLDLEQEGKLDEAVLKYAEAAQADPEAGEYRLRFLKAREQAARVHLKMGDGFMAEKKYDESFQQYQTALALDSGLDRAAVSGAKARNLRDAQQFFREG
jgi:general secretion pathway protein D